MSKKSTRKARTAVDWLLIGIILGTILGLIASGLESVDEPTDSGSGVNNVVYMEVD